MDTAATARTRDQGRPRGAKRSALYARDGHRCVYCCRPVIEGAPMSDPSAATIDHCGEAFAAGGDWSPENTVTCCAACNRHKHAKALARFIRQLAAERHPGDKPAQRREITRITNRVRAALRRPVPQIEVVS